MLLPMLISVIAVQAGQAQVPEVPVEAAPVPLERAQAPLLFEDLSDEAVLDRAAAAIDGIDTLRARFTQTAPSGAVTSGTVSMDRPGRLLFDYEAPSAQRIVATGGLVYVHDTDLETTDSYPIGQTPLRYLLTDGIDTDDVVLTGVTRMPGEVAVALRAADDALSGEVALVFADADGTLALSRWAVVDPQGGVTVVALDEVETGVKLSRRLFRIPQAERRFGNDRR